MSDGRVLRFEILGEVRALRDGTPIDLGPAKQRAVLAVLLLQPGRPVPTHQIVDAVWGDEPPENGANVVQKYVAGLRRVLDPDRAPRTPGELVALTGGGYVLRTTEASVDAEEFQTQLATADTHRRAGQSTEAAERLRAALALWQGDALAGLGGPVFDAARNRLADMRASAWEKWSEIEVALGHHTAVIPDLARLVEQFPLREGLRAQLMIALHQSGRQAEALAVFRDARQYFLDELGAEPGERMQAAHHKILRGEPFYSEPVDPWASADTPVSPPPAYAPPPAAYTPPPPTYTPPPAVYAPPPQYHRPPMVDPPSEQFLAMLNTAARAKRRLPILEMIAAAVLPIITLGFAEWVYFVFVGLRRHDRRQFIVAAVYATLLITGFALAQVGPDPEITGVYTTAQDVGYSLWLIPAFVSIFHGVLLAVQVGQNRKDWLRREVAREFALREPQRARHMGVGRPFQLRNYSDGGLVDINHAAAAELSTLSGISPETAHRIVADRQHRGAFRSVDDLVQRGLVRAGLLQRLAFRVVCIAPDPVVRHY